MSRLLRYLSDELSKASGPKETLHLRTRLAIHLFRSGEVIAAAQEVSEMRRLAGAGMMAESTARANLVEGVAAICVDNYPLAADKFRRATVLIGTSVPQVARWVDSWLAHLELNLGRVEMVRPYAEVLIANCPGTEHWVLSRIGSTMASGLHFGNRFDLARPWYEFARQHAVDEGDDLTIDANLYNVAALRIHNLRLSEIASAVDGVELIRAEMELRSSFNYDSAKAPKSFRWAIPLIEMQLNLLLGRTDLLLGQLPKWIESFRSLVPKRHLVLALADYALVVAQSGDRQRAVNGLADAIDGTPDDMADDEFALLRFRQSQIARLGGDASSATENLAAAIALFEINQKSQLRVASALASVSCPLRPKGAQLD